MNHDVCYYKIPLRHFELRSGMHILDMLMWNLRVCQSSRAQKYVILESFFHSLYLITNCYGIPVGIMNDIQSPVSPHSARYNWNTVIHITRAAVHIMVPIPDITTYFLISLCSSYGGFLNASAKNQTAFTHHRNGRNANPAR